MNFDSGPDVSTSTPLRLAIPERRRDPRCSFSADAEVVDVLSGTCLFLAARVSDLSMGGCHLETIHPFERGTRAHLRIGYRNVYFSCVGTVKSTQPGAGMGLAFEELDQAHSDLLRSWLAESIPPTPANLEVADAAMAVPAGTPPLDRAVSTSQTNRGETEPLPQTTAATADAYPQAANDLLSLRLAKLLLRKGLLDEAEMTQLLKADLP